jgi:DNA-binding MarR family transcriptional regulator
MSELDPVIHQPVRLQVMSALAALAATERLDFTFLKDHLQLTDGNLGAHLQKLEESKYIAVQKVFESRKPRTYVKLTSRGREAFAEHVAALEAILRLRPNDSVGD